ncbi:MAG: peptidoglycan-binding domain-containing protein [bacterium]
MKAKEADASVGNVQKFLNLYFKTSNKIDNDYGASTQKAVASFQKDQGLKADGFAGPPPSTRW